MKRRRLGMEQCEPRRLLAADLQAWHDPAPATDPPAQPGDEVTRVVRFYNNGDESALAEINSSLTAELDNPTWQRQVAVGRAIHNVTDLLPGHAADVSIPDAWDNLGLQPIGDVNGDDFQDFLQIRGTGSRPSTKPESATSVILGGISASANGETQLSLDQVAVVLSPGSTAYNHEPYLNYSRLGDLDGDGFDDFSIDNRIIWGHAEFGSRPALDLESDVSWQLTLTDANAIRGIGDANGDGHADLIVYGRPDKTIVWGGQDIRRSGNRTLADWLPANTTSLLGESHSAAPAGDLNDDGIQDVAVMRRLPYGNPHRAAVTLLFGGKTLSETETIDLDQIRPTRVSTYRTRSRPASTCSTRPLSSPTATGMWTAMGLTTCWSVSTAASVAPIAAGRAVTWAPAARY